jgi:hypothetical protein
VLLPLTTLWLLVVVLVVQILAVAVAQEDSVLVQD